VEQAFQTQKGLFTNDRHYCPDCVVKRGVESYVLLLGLFTFTGFLLYALDPWSVISATYFGIGVFLVSLPFLVIVHELAHTAAAKLLGLRVFGVQVGVGRSVWSGKFLNMTWAIHLVPLAGFTFVGVKPMPAVRWRIFFTYLAGPAVHVVLAALFFIQRQSLFAYSIGARAYTALVVVNLALFIANLYPRKLPSLAETQGTDGWHLARALFSPESELQKIYSASYAMEAWHAYLESDYDAARKWVDRALTTAPDSFSARTMLGLIQMGRGDYSAARVTFQRLLETEDAKQPGYRYLMLNNLAYVNALSNDASLLPEADQLSADAFACLPWIPAIVGTRGTVLVEMGRFEEGIALLKKSMSMHSDKNGKALNACHAAVGEFRRGNAAEARKFLSAARTLDPKCILLARVEAEVGASV
jgi:tetratricopeptide (TPR) repeat protein